MTDGLILVEGNLDAVSLHAHGFPNAVAGLGTALTENQASLIRRYASSVYVCYDSDDAGLKAAEKAIELLTNAGVKLKVVSYSGAKDPDEYLKLKGVESFKELLKSALSATEYKIMKVRKNYYLVSSQDKVDFIEQAAQILAKNTNEVEREIFIKRIAKETDISADSILAEVNKCIYHQNRKEYKKAERTAQNVKQTQPTNRLASSQKPASTAS